MSKIVGYLEGTDPRLLNNLVLKGVGTMPLSNGFDSHGKQVGYLTKQDGIDMVVGWLYKVVPPQDMDLELKDILFACTTYKIPVILAASQELHDYANKIQGGIPDGVTLVAPEKLIEEVNRTLGL
jgi:hypothetical protein